MRRRTSLFFAHFLYPPLYFYRDLLVIIVSLFELGHVDVVGMYRFGRVPINGS